MEKALALDREDTLKKAEKLLRQGRLDGAIAEYVRVVEDQPKDWNTANALGDLYVRASQPDKAVAQYSRIADHFFQEGFYPKAAALYKKILKIAPDHEPSQLNLAAISVKQGLLADAKAYLGIVAARRRTRGDKRGADEIVVRLGSIDPADIDARFAAARVVADNGDVAAAGSRFRELHADLQEKGRTAEALTALREAVRLNPEDVAARAILARAAVAAGDLQTARGYLDRDTAGDDPSLLLALADIELRSGELDSAREILPKLLALNRDVRHAIVELAWTLSESKPDAAFVCVDAAVDASIAVDDFDDAAAVLQEFVTRQPAHIQALLKLVEVCVDGRFETTMYDAQAQLTDAYLSGGQPTEARVIAEDLVAREPWEAAHIERFRRALVMLRVPEPDTVIAERLSGQTPFVATDHFADASESDLPPAPAPPPAPLAVAAEPPKREEREAPEPPSVPVTSQVETPVAVQRSPQPAPEHKPKRGGVEIDLTSVLGEMEAAAAPPAPVAPPPPPKPESLDDVFKGFQKEAGSAEAQDQAAQHMKLAQTYVDMGMLDEASNALKMAARSPRHRFEAASWLARLYKEQGDVPHAIEWFERAAEAPARTTEESHALLYDLGVTLEQAGETSRALAVFLELLADTGEYRDVSDRADRLTRVQTGG